MTTERPMPATAERGRTIFPLLSEPETRRAIEALRLFESPPFSTLRALRAAEVTS